VRVRRPSHADVGKWPQKGAEFTNRRIKAAFLYFLCLFVAIRSPRYGLNERGNLGLTFAAYVAENEGAMQFVPASLANKVIEAYEFLRSVASGIQSEPGFEAAAAVANAQQAMIASWDSDRWEPIRQEAQ